MIITVAFEGLNRSGKGTQIALAQKHLVESGIPTISLRGDGSREGLGIYETDPLNTWWQEFRDKTKKCTSEHERFQLWNEAADILADEYIHWKECIFPQRLEQANSKVGIILLDRSLISRLMTYVDANGKISLNELYNGESLSSPITWMRMCPDTIILLEVGQSELLKRLSPTDPKFCFRMRLISEKFNLFCKIMENLPQEIAEITTILDGEQEIGAVEQNVRQIVASVIANKAKICNNSGVVKI